MSKRVICKDNTNKRISQTIVRINGWNDVRCLSYEEHDNHVEALLASTRLAVRCPCCGKRSSHIHSSYFRDVDSLPIGGKEVRLAVSVRRFRCKNPKCKRHTFVEQITGLTERYQRRTPKLRTTLETVLAPVAAKVGANQCKELGISISAETAVRIVRRIENNVDYESVKHICIDDFADRKGCTYKTLIIDADTHVPLEIIESREEDDVVRALRKYKKVTVVSRDRSATYTKAISRAIPKAKQVADRFHLIKNCGEHIEREMKKKADQIFSEVTSLTSAPVEEGISMNSLYGPPSQKDLELFEQIHSLRSRGLSQDVIAAELRINRKTVAKYLSMDKPLGRKIVASKIVIRYINIIKDGVEKGKSYRDIHSDIIASGGHCEYNSLCKGMKKAFPEYKPKQGVFHKNSPLDEAKRERGELVHLLRSNKFHIYLKNPGYGVNKKTGECSQDYIRACRLIEASDTLKELRKAYMSFRDVMSGDDANALDQWIDKYLKPGKIDLSSFAKGLTKDIKGIKNAIKFKYSNGPIEGCNNKIKAVKRSMFGRAKSDLLLIKIQRYAASS